MEILINQEFRGLIPPLAPEELLGLEESLIAEGNRVPIDTWQGYIVDGHNRYDICQKNNIRKYTCQDCGRRFDVFTVSPVVGPHVCFDCQQQHTTLKAYANALGACIKDQK